MLSFLYQCLPAYCVVSVCLPSLLNNVTSGQWCGWYGGWPLLKIDSRAKAEDFRGDIQ